MLIGTARRQKPGSVDPRAVRSHSPRVDTCDYGGRKLISKGLLTKSANPRDRRGVLVRLSPAGEAAVLEVAPLLRRVNDVLFQHVTAKEFMTFLQFLSKFARTSEHAEVEIRQAERERNATGRPQGGRKRR